jgi:hypothetical protein
MNNKEKLQKALEGACKEMNVNLQGAVTSGHQEICYDEKNRRIILNPGAGKCEEGTFEQACRNINCFIEDCSVPLEINEKHDIPDVNNRYMFKLVYDTGIIAIRFEVLMPGVELKKVRYRNLENQDIWDFPRIIVDDESYVWEYGLINKDKVFRALTNMIKYHRENMDLKFVCLLLVSAQLTKHRLAEGKEFDFNMIGQTIRIEQLTKSLHKGYRKTDIAMLDQLIEEILEMLEN